MHSALAEVRNCEWGELNTRISGGIQLNTACVKRRIFASSPNRSVACCLSKDAEARRPHGGDATVTTRRSPKVGEHVLSGASELELIRQGKS